MNWGRSISHIVICPGTMLLTSQYTGSRDLPAYVMSCESVHLMALKRTSRMLEKLNLLFMLSM